MLALQASLRKATVSIVSAEKKKKAKKTESAADATWSGKNPAGAANLVTIYLYLLKRVASVSVCPSMIIGALQAKLA